MMTTMCALFGGLPLALGHGAGSELRRPLGVAIIGGLLVSQVLTLYTTPVIYLYLDRVAKALVPRGRRVKRTGPASGCRKARIEIDVTGLEPRRTKNRAGRRRSPLTGSWPNLIRPSTPDRACSVAPRPDRSGVDGRVRPGHDMRKWTAAFASTRQSRGLGRPAGTAESMGGGPTRTRESVGDAADAEAESGIATDNTPPAAQTR